MKTINKVVLLSSICLMMACEKSIDLKSSMDTKQLTGHWINPVLTDTLWKFKKSGSLKKNDYGISFKSDQSFVERKNSGWCGTPPISYGDFKGIWSIQDSTINITVGYWGGRVDYQWKIISMDSNHLTIFRMKEEYHYTED
jgi:hypothetical protein